MHKINKGNHNNYPEQLSLSSW